MAWRGCNDSLPALDSIYPLRMGGVRMKEAAQKLRSALGLIESQDARTALPQNCSRAKVKRVLDSVNRTSVPRIWHQPAIRHVSLLEEECTEDGTGAVRFPGRSATNVLCLSVQIFAIDSLAEIFGFRVSFEESTIWNCGYFWHLGCTVVQEVGSVCRFRFSPNDRFHAPGVVQF